MSVHTKPSLKMHIKGKPCFTCNRWKSHKSTVTVLPNASSTAFSSALDLSSIKIYVNMTAKKVSMHKTMHTLECRTRARVPWASIQGSIPVSFSRPWEWCGDSQTAQKTSPRGSRGHGCPPHSIKTWENPYKRVIQQ